MWTACDNLCSQARTRQREITRPAVPGKLCEYPEIEQELCFEGRNCWPFTQIWESWTSCWPLKSKTCGTGYRYRRANCFYGERVVHPNKCLDIGSADMVEECFIKCDKDCEITNWTRWSSCAESCGQTTKTRTRVIKRF